MPQVDLILSPAQHYSSRELAETLRYELELQDVPGAITLGEFPRPEIGRVPVLIDPLGYLAAQGPRSLPAPALLRRTVFVCPGRQIGLSEQAIELLGLAGTVFVDDQRSVTALHRAGVPARLLRPGYTKLRDHYEPGAERPIDVMLIGAYSDRRARQLARAADVLARRNCLLQLFDGPPVPGPTTSFAADGRWPLLAATKIVMLVHRDDDPEFEWQAAIDAIHTGAVVVSEHAAGLSPLAADQQLLVASPESLPFVVDRLLSDPDRLAALREAAYARLSVWIPYALGVSILRATLVELVGEPIEPSAPLTGTGLDTQRNPTAREAAVVELVSAPPATGDDARAHRLQREVDDARRESGELRRRLADLQATVIGSLRGDRPEPTLAFQSPAWSARPEPRVTVVTVVQRSDDDSLATLDSLAAARYPDAELIVVGDSLGAAQRQGLRSWLAARPRLPSRFLTPDLGLTHGAARNLALEWARGRHCLLLDPGQLAHPRLLEVLVPTLEGLDGVVFVYPICAIDGEAEPFVRAGGSSLLSYLGWDPAALRRGNPIQCPALIELEALRQLGCFASDPLLDGWEDYDLWCRIAERDWRGQLVPQILASRRESGTSPLLRVLDPVPGPATAALAERSPVLLADAFTR